MSNYINESHIYYRTKEFLKHAGWHVLAGEPSGGSDDLPRIEIRDPSHRLKGSKGSYKIDLISCKGKELLLTEVKIKFNNSDILKLNEITTAKLPLLKKALIERLNFDLDNYKIIKSVALNTGLASQIPDDFICFRVPIEDEITLINGRLFSEN